MCSGVSPEGLSQSRISKYALSHADSMPSFDIVSELDSHEVTNAVDQANRELSQRFDFKDTGAVFELNDLTVAVKAQVEFQEAPSRVPGLARPRGRVDASSGLLGEGVCHRGRRRLDRLRLRGDRCRRGVQRDPAVQCSIAGRRPSPGADPVRGAVAVQLPRVAPRNLETVARRLAAGGIPVGPGGDRSTVLSTEGVTADGGLHRPPRSHR